MNAQIKWLALCVVVLGAVSAIWLNLSTPGSDPHTAYSNRLLPELADSGDLIEYIEVKRGQEPTLTIRKVENEWVVYFGTDSEQFFPANSHMLQSMLLKLARSEKREKKTKNPAHHATLGVESLDVEDNYSTQISLHSAGKTWSLLIGRISSSGTGTYVRYLGDDQVWLVDQMLELPLSKIGWINQPVLPFESVRKIERIDAANEWSVEITNNGEVVLSKHTSSAENRVRYPNILENYLTGWRDVVMNDLMWLEDATLVSLPEPMAQYQITNQSGEVALISMYHMNQKFWLRCQGCYEYLDTSKWLMEISTFSATQINKHRSDFLAVENE